MVVYAVEYNGEWYVAEQVRAWRYGSYAAQHNLPEDAKVWAELRTTALICDVGKESNFVVLGP